MVKKPMLANIRLQKHYAQSPNYKSIQQKLQLIGHNLCVWILQEVTVFRKRLKELTYKQINSTR